MLDATTPRLRRIWSLREGMSAYDATVETLRAPSLTADPRLLRACRAAAIPVTLLDDLVPGH